MDSKEWDDILKDKLDDYTPEGIQPDWSAFSDYLHVHDELSGLEENPLIDESLKDSIAAYNAPGDVEGWDRINSSLDLADKQFDEKMRHRLERFESKYERNTWPLLLQRLSGIAYLRAKLIAFKVVEVAAVFLLLFTVVKLGQIGKLPFETPLYEKTQEPVKTNVPKTEMADNFKKPTHTSNDKPDIQAISSIDGSLLNSNRPQSDETLLNKSSHQQGHAYQERQNQNTESIASFTTIAPSASDKTLVPHDSREFKPVEPIHSESIYTIISDESEDDITETHSSIASITTAGDEDIISFPDHSMASADFIATFPSPVQWNNEIILPKPKYIKQRSRTYTEFGVVSQLDYNRLRMPEDRLISAGRQIVFPQKGIASNSFGGGFSIALGHPRWAIETGMIYSAKNFRTGRQLIIGDAFDNGSVDFEAMRLQLVSIPLQYRYRFDNKGAFKVYGVAGFGLHLIAQSDFDVVIKYHFPSLSFGENPNHDPDLAQTIKETRRVSEHIRDGAPFSTKSFFCLHGGIGAEYSISEHKTLFLQSSLQYQIPNLEFSNNNGKHLRSVSIQAGVRTPLGK